MMVWLVAVAGTRRSDPEDGGPRCGRHPRTQLRPCVIAALVALAVIPGVAGATSHVSAPDVKTGMVVSQPRLRLTLTPNLVKAGEPLHVHLRGASRIHCMLVLRRGTRLVVRHALRAPRTTFKI